MPAPDYAEEIATLRAGLASGEAEIQTPDGARVRYRSVDEIRKAIAAFRVMADEASNGGAPTRRTTYARFERR